MDERLTQTQLSPERIRQLIGIRTGKISLADVVSYEVYSSVWAPLVRCEWAQSLAAKYFARKAIRKHQRYEKMMAKEADKEASREQAEILAFTPKENETGPASR